MFENLIDQAKAFDRDAVEKFEALIKKGEYKHLHTICRWVGLPVPLTAAYLILGLYAYFLGGWKLFVLEIVTLILTNVVNLRLKALFKRVRPSSAVFWSPLKDDHYAFPSGHAATTMSLAIALGYPNGGLIWVLLPWALFMGIARFLGELHHPSDILAGFVVGLTTGFIIQAVFFMVW